MTVRWLLAKIIYKLQIPAVKNSQIHKKAKICTGAVVNSCSIDRYSFVGPFSQVQHCKIGAFCSIARGVIIGPAEHPLDYLSTSPVFLKGRNCLRKHFAQKEFQACKETYIGNDVWIGMNACIKGGVKIGDGAVIGMGAVVTKDVGPYEIWGVPAVFIRKRFEEDTIEKLLESQWWTQEETKLREIQGDIEKIRFSNITDE